MENLIMKDWLEVAGRYIAERNGITEFEAQDHMLSALFEDDVLESLNNTIKIRLED